MNRGATFTPILLLALVLSICSCVMEGDRGSLPGKTRVTVFDNFGPKWSGYRSGGWSVAGIYGGNNWGVEQAMAFTSESMGTLSDIWVTLSYAPEDQAREVVFKVALDSNNLPGRILESWTLDSGFTPWGKEGTPHHMIGSGRTSIEIGEKYWLWATAEDLTFVAWNDNVDPRMLCPHTERREGKNWLPTANETCSVFRIDILK